MQEIAQQQLQNPNKSTIKSVRSVRLQKQYQILSTKYNYEIDNNSINNQDKIIIKNILPLYLTIHIPKDYPFIEPKYTYDNKQGYISQVIGQWLPKYKILEIIQFVAIKIKQKQRDQKILQQHTIYQIFSNKNVDFKFVLLIAILIRILISLGSYSGKEDWPNLGDFQAHRNWMSITLNRPIEYWYYQDSDQPWWRIDYPPIAAYLSYIFALFYNKIEPQSMAEQHGYESDKLQAFMRFTTLIIDVLLNFTATILLTQHRNNKCYKIFLLLALLRPDLLLIDHGHFQYNSLIIGLILGAFYLMMNDKYYLCCVIYTIAIFSKQMAVYYSLAFFSGLIGLTYNKYKYSKKKFGIEILKYGFIVILVSIIILIPWLSSMEGLKTFLSAIFPIHRGLYQLKVPNWWCLTDPLIKWQQKFSKQFLMIVCSISCLVFSSFSCFCIIVHPIKKVLLIGFLNIGLTFFMFSYHVHQKSILLPITFMVIILGEGYFGRLGFDFIIAGCVGMYHLIVQDGLIIQYFVILTLYSLLALPILQIQRNLGNSQNNDILTLNEKYYNTKIVKICLYSLFIILHVCWYMIPPPLALPYLYNLLFAAYGFLINCYVLIIGNLTIFWQVWNSRIIKKD